MAIESGIFGIEAIKISNIYSSSIFTPILSLVKKNIYYNDIGTDDNNVAYNVYDGECRIVFAKKLTQTIYCDVLFLDSLNS